MNQNIFNKEISEGTFNNNTLDIKHPMVLNIYIKHKKQCDKFIDFNKQYDPREKYYVYIWYANSSPRKIFYIGKGTRQRYNHVIRNIDMYKSGKTKNNRFKQYSIIQDIWTIDYEIVIDKLCELDAIIYEQSLKLDLLINGEVLLNVEGVPTEYLPDGWEGLSIITDVPTLQKSRFRMRYLGDTTPVFDVVDESLKNTYFYPYYLPSRSTIIDCHKETISSWIIDNGGSIFPRPTKKVESVIVQGYLPHDRYSEYKENGKKIFSSIDVLKKILTI